MGGFLRASSEALGLRQYGAFEMTWSNFEMTWSNFYIRL